MGRWMGALGGYVNLDHATTLQVVEVEVPDDEPPRWAVVVQMLDGREVGLDVFLDPDLAHDYSRALAMGAQGKDHP